MPRTSWSDTRIFSPKVTPNAVKPRVMDVDQRSHPAAVAEWMSDALEGERAIVLGRAEGARMMICHALPLASGVLLITKDSRSSGIRPNARAAAADARRLVAAEFGHE